MMPSWKDRRNYTEVLVADDGEVLATISDPLNATGYFLHVNGTTKNYYTLEQAKQAAERLVKEN